MDKKALELKIKKLELKEQVLAEKKRHEAEQHRLAVKKMEIEAEELAAKKDALLAKLDNDKDPDPEPEPEKDDEPEKPEDEEPTTIPDTETEPAAKLNPDDPQTDVLEERSFDHIREVEEVEEAAKEPLPSMDLFGGKNPQEMTDEDLASMFDSITNGVVDEARNSLTSPLDFLEEKKGA